MKKLLLFILACSISLAGFSQDNDYKWLVGADTGATYLSADGVNAGNITAQALYSVTDDLMLGGAISFNFGDAEGESIFLAGRYYLGDIFAAASYDLGDSDTGANIGLGYGWDVADNVEFSPQLSYNLDFEVTTLAIGFAIRF